MADVSSLARYTGAGSTFRQERNTPQCQRNSEHRGYNNAVETSISPHPTTVESIGYTARVQSEYTPPQQQEHAQPPKEIERKFIIDPTSSTFTREVLAGKSLDNFDHTTLRQGYLAIRDDGSEERIRSFGDIHFEYTMKSGGDLVRDEENTPLGREDFAVLWPRTAGARVEKHAIKFPIKELYLSLISIMANLLVCASARLSFLAKMKQRHELQQMHLVLLPGLSTMSLQMSASRTNDWPLAVQYRFFISDEVSLARSQSLSPHSSSAVRRR